MQLLVFIRTILAMAAKSVLVCFSRFSYGLIILATILARWQNNQRTIITHLG